MAVMLAGIELPGVQEIHTDEGRAIVEHRVPGLVGSVLQDLGRGATVITLAGIFHGEEVLEDLEELRDPFKAGEPVLFTADITTATEVDQVLIQDLRVSEVAGRKSYFRYAVTLREYVEVGAEAPDQLQDGEIAQASTEEAASFLKDAEKTVELESGLRDIGVLNEGVMDLLEEIGLDNLFGYTAPTLSGKLTQVFDDLSKGISDVAEEEEVGGQVAAMVKTFGLILGKALLTDVAAGEQTLWEQIKGKFGDAVAG